MIKKIVLLLLLLYFCMAQQQQQQYDFIYQQNQMSSQLFKNSQLNILQMKSSSLYTVVAAGQSGLWWINNTSTQLIESATVSLKNQDQVSALAITADGNYLLNNYQNKLSLFKVNPNDFSMTLLRQGQNSLAITDIFLTSNEKIAIIVGEKGSVIAYDIWSKTPNQPLLILSQYNSQTNILAYITLSSDMQWLYIADQFLGATILKLTYAENQDGSIKTFNMNLAGQVGGLYFVAQVQATNDNQYLYALDRWYGVQIISLSPLISAKPSSYPVQLKITQLFWPYTDMNPVFMGALISSDSNYLIISVRSQGLIAFDISNRLNPTYYYQIKIPGIPQYIAFTPLQSQIYYTDGTQMIVYDKVQSNLNDDFPNLFNGHQSNLKVFSQAYYQWRCYITPDTQWMLVPETGNVNILSIPNSDPYQITLSGVIKKSGKTRTCNLEFSSDFRYMYQPVNYNINTIDIYDLNTLASNSQSMAITSSLNVASPQRNENISFSKDQKLLVQTFAQGIQIIDSSDILNLKILTTWNVPLVLNGFPGSVGISHDNKWVIIAMRNVGMYLFLDITDPKNPVLQNQITTNGGEQVVISGLYNLAYLCDGSNGLAILDISYLPKIKIISRIAIDGWANQCNLFQNEDFMLISSMDYGMITLVNLLDKQNPVVYSKYQESTQQSFGNCYFKDLSYGFSISQYGLRIFPLKSQIKIHSSFIDITSSNSNPKTVGKSSNLLVGQQIQLQLMMLYAVEGSQITNVYYYSNYQMNSLPYWINFVKSQGSILINVDKSSIDPSNISGSFLNTLIVQVSVPITAQSFIYDGLTNSAQSQAIYNYYQQLGFIDGDNLVTPIFNPNMPISFNVVQLSNPQQNQQLYDKVKLTLQRGIYYNPILFYTAQSLKFDFMNKQQMIQTYSSTVQVSITVTNPIMGIFVNMPYSGVIVSISTSQNQIVLQGPLSNLNKILQNKIFFSEKSPLLSQVTDNGQPQGFILYIDDGINYSQQYTIMLQDAISSFIHIKSEVQLQPSYLLQQQVNDKYSGANVPVIDEVSLEFLPQTFSDQDGFQLSFSAYQKQSDDTFIELKSDYWFKFSNYQLRFYGNAPKDLLNTSVTLKVVATDGYTTVSDVFTINLNQLPLQYVLNLIVSILTPLLSILGIYKYRYVIVNFLNYNNTIYSKETVKTNQVYYKIIPLLGKNLQKSKMMVQQFIHHIQQQKFNSEYQNQQQNVPEAIKESKIVELLLKENPTKHERSNKEMEAYINKQNNMQMTDLHKKIVQKLTKVSIDNNIKSQVFSKICNKDGIVDMQKVLEIIENNIIEYKFNGKKMKISDDIQELKDSSSMLHICVFCLLSRFILSLNSELSFFYEYLKQYSVALKFYYPNDWYKNYITFNYALNEQEQQNIDDISQKNILSLFQFKDDFIKLALESLKQSPQYSEVEQKFKYKNINHNILKQVLIADALGIDSQPIFRYKKCLGESLLIDFSNIQSIEAYKKSGQTNSCCQRKSQFNYTQYGLFSNLKLPYWMQIINKQDLIILQGKPSLDDVDSLQIRIIDNKNYIIKSYNLDILVQDNIQVTKINQFQKQNSKDFNSSNNILTTADRPIRLLNFNQNKRQISQFENYSLNTYIGSNDDEIIENMNLCSEASPQQKSLLNKNVEVKIKIDEDHNSIYASKRIKQKSEI
ncbi:calpain family cysteine protease (macronuclear) [Tetrahymena thermophila SB210]|uniref:Calpain family cysteine protease n=1 Tax=Tetrahymena thermophila (strain SB210) TaxID=312017 RepID=Q22GH7_TETTS|nr:calpain family cysteine protease [Tetrahymena thermophila SB210]EAR84354.2 calpain family cysteine protease [Tetrahymena thermophila SB210]|eukprot:XP_001032017.2 calpain family cysteine protease [Tetrahymena thermophila SB210]